MTLDTEVCSRARLARDARFDGKFYIGVLTTRIYCRPICRARTSREKNVRYFLSAAAAAEAGFRPCLRCRPESSPGTAAWAGTKTTVSRALRLIHESGLEEGGIETLAEHLGLGSRHLRRLFLRHLGASPRAVAQTRRLHFAKKLIDETCLPMTQIAIAAGFGSVRRFNACIHKTYQRTPTQIRERSSARLPAQPQNQYRFSLDFRPPYAWQEMLAMLRADATPGIEVVDADSYRRSISLNGASGHLHVTLDDSGHALQVRVEIDEPRLLFLIIEKVRGIFDLNADWPSIEEALRHDPALAARMHSHPGLRIAGCFDGFEPAVRAILGQPRAATRAGALTARLVAKLGTRVEYPGGLTHLFPSAQVLAEASLEQAGVPAPQAHALRTLAREVSQGRIGFDKVADPRALLRRLATLPGFSAAALEYVAMRALREPDAFPLDSAAAARLLNLETSEARRRLRALRPWRAYAAAYLSVELR